MHIIPLTTEDLLVRNSWYRQGESIQIKGRIVANESSSCAALSGLLAIVMRNPGLTPWAFLLDPFGVPSFVLLRN